MTEQKNGTIEFYRSLVKIALAVGFAVLLMAMLFLEFKDPEMSIDPTTRYIIVLMILVLIGLADPKRLLSKGVE